MELTKEQQEKIYTAACKESLRRRGALYNALDALQVACSVCWFRETGAGCEQSRCSVWRMVKEFQKMLRMRGRGQLDSWNWFAEAKDNDRLLFINPDSEEN